MADLLKAWLYILLAGIFLFTLAWLVNAMIPSGEPAQEVGLPSEPIGVAEQETPLETTEPDRETQLPPPQAVNEPINRPPAETEPDPAVDSEGALPHDQASATEPGPLQPLETATPAVGETPAPPVGDAQAVNEPPPPRDLSEAPVQSSETQPSSPGEAETTAGSLPLGDLIDGDTVPPEDHTSPIDRLWQEGKLPISDLPLPETTHFEPPVETEADSPPPSEAELCLPLGAGTLMAEPDLKGFVLLKNEDAALVGAVAKGTIVKIIQSPHTGLTVYQRESGGNHCFLYGGMGELAAGLAVGNELECGAVIGTTVAGEGIFFSVSAFEEDQSWWQGRRIDPRPFITHAR